MTPSAREVLERAGLAEIGAEELGRFPKDADDPVFVAFTARWCEVSREAAPAIAGLAARLGGRARFAQADVDGSALEADRLGVRSVPAVLLFARGREVARRVGLASEEELARFAEKGLNDVQPKAAPEAGEPEHPSAGGPVEDGP